MNNSAGSQEAHDKLNIRTEDIRLDNLAELGSPQTTSCHPRPSNDENDLTEPLLSIASSPSSQSSDEVTFWGLFFFKFLFFLNGLSASTWGRFSVIYYNQVAHLSPERIGTLQAVAPLLSFLMMPIWGISADYIQSRKTIYVVCKTIGTLCLVALGFLPDPPEFRSILLCISGVALFRASGILDAYVLDYLKDQKERYGEIRLYTAVSWGLGAIVMGYITDLLDFAWNFTLYGTMMSMMVILIIWKLPARSKTELERYERLESSSEDHTRPEFRALYMALARLPILWWILEVSIIGAGMAIVESFLFVYLQNTLGASTRLCGWTVGVTVVFELPIFAYSKECLKWIGHDGLFSISLVAYVTRVYGYTLLTESTLSMVLALEILHGVTFACMWIASIDFSAKIAPPEWSTAVQSLLSAAFTCFGSIFGPLIGGWVIEHYSAVVLYRGMAVIALAVLVIHSIIWKAFLQGHDEFLKKLEAENVEHSPQQESSSISDDLI